MAIDLVKFLRSKPDTLNYSLDHIWTHMEEAADEIKQLQDKLASADIVWREQVILAEEETNVLRVKLDEAVAENERLIELLVSDNREP